MSRTHSFEAIVLRTVDVNEADRFCIFFTRERGRIAARARGVRKLQSRLGGVLLPFRHLNIEVAESDHSKTITGATPHPSSAIVTPDITAFVRWERGVELLLALTEEDEPLPRVFELLRSFLVLASDRLHDPLVPFQLKLLALLGLLPANDEDRRFANLAHDAKLYVKACATIANLSDLVAVPLPHDGLPAFLESVLTEHLSRPLKSNGMSL